MVDLSSVRVLSAGRLVPAQFLPSDDFEAGKRERGELLILAAVRGLKGVIRFGTTDDPKALRLPYPPRSFRRVLEDGRAAPIPYAARMQLTPEPGGRLAVEEDGRLVTIYQHHPDEPRPYLYPLIGPAGRGLTRLGHPHDPGDTHVHHHSLWVGFRGVNGENFWEERQGGRLRHAAFERQEDGPVCAMFRSLVHWETQAGERVLEERREVRVYRAAGGRLLDFDLNFRGIDGASVSLDQTSFGFLAIRMAKNIGVFDGGGLILNSEGGINEPGVFWKPARWCDYSGPVAEERDGTPIWNGIAFLDHPANPHHPTPWHVRPDGWMGAAFAQAQGHVIPRGASLRLRYRLYVHPGGAKEARAEAAWHDYAYPAKMRLGQPGPVKTS
jgi:hypothetical protein